jgi:hypothetical protein
MLSHYGSFGLTTETEGLGHMEKTDQSTCLVDGRLLKTPVYNRSSSPSCTKDLPDGEETTPSIEKAASTRQLPNPFLVQEIAGTTPPWTPTSSTLQASYHPGSRLFSPGIHSAPPSILSRFSHPFLVQQNAETASPGLPHPRHSRHHVTLGLVDLVLAINPGLSSTLSHFGYCHDSAVNATPTFL